MDIQKLKELASECGFSEFGVLNVDTLVFKPEVRAMCASDKCHNYNRSWSCPPAVPSLEEMTEKVKGYKNAFIVQTVGQLEDQFDGEGMMEAAAKHGENFNKLTELLRPMYPNLLPMGAGGCTKCAKCTYPDEPCRFPGYMTHSMEACGLVVSEVCTANNIPYNHGKNAIAYTGCFLLD